MIDNDHFRVHECGCGVGSDLNPIQVEPVERCDQSFTAGHGVVVGDYPNLDSSLMDCIEKCCKDGELLVLLLAQSTSHAGIAHLTEGCALAPTVKPYWKEINTYFKIYQNGLIKKKV